VIGVANIAAQAAHTAVIPTGARTMVLFVPTV